VRRHEPGKRKLEKLSAGRASASHELSGLPLLMGAGALLAAGAVLLAGLLGVTLVRSARRRGQRS